MARYQTATTPIPVPKPKAAMLPTPATEREHERILSSYGGSYDDPKLEALIGKLVDRLVAASDRPEQPYKVTILNSGAVNAFALPTGQLYVTRGLIALASDTSELSSVLSHEMAHVLSKHAAIREDQARQAALVARVVTDMGNDPDVTAFTLAKSKLTMASFSRTQEFEADDMGVAISARAHFDPYGASRFLTSMERNAELKAGKSSLDPRAQDFLSSHPATPERVQRAQTAAKQYTSPDNTERDREDYLSAIDNIVYGEDPSEGFVRGRRFLHPKLAFTFQTPESFTLDNTAQAVIGVRDGGAQAMRFDVVRVPAEQTLGDYLNSGWMENVDKTQTEELTINGFPAASTVAQGEQWQFRAYALRFGGDPVRVGDRFRFPIEDYLFARGDDYVQKYRAESFLTLSQSIDLHQMDATQVTTPATLIAVREDQLVPFNDMQALSARLNGPRQLIEINSIFGHDAFLKEGAALTPIIKQALAEQQT